MLQDKKREECQAYLREHGIKELFEDLTTALAYKQPGNVENFLIKELQIRQDRNCITLPIFTENEVETIFKLYNLKNSKFITKEKAREALNCIAHSTQDIKDIEENKEIPDFVDLITFKNLAKCVLGVSFE